MSWNRISQDSFSHCDFRYLKMSTIQIGPFRVSNDVKTKIKVKVQLDIHGIVSIHSASVSVNLHVTLLVYQIRSFDGAVSNFD